MAFHDPTQNWGKVQERWILFGVRSADSHHTHRAQMSFICLHDCIDEMLHGYEKESVKYFFWGQTKESSPSNVTDGRSNHHRRDALERNCRLCNRPLNGEPNAFSDIWCCRRLVSAANASVGLIRLMGIYTGWTPTARSVSRTKQWAQISPEVLLLTQYNTVGIRSTLQAGSGCTIHENNFFCGRGN